jgi:hypothetical protein
MARRRVQKATSRIPEPTTFRMRGTLTGTSVANYMDSVIKTLRLKFESVEAQIDAQDNKMRVEFIENETDVNANFEKFCYLIDASIGTVNFELPDALEAFDERVVYSVREISGANQVDVYAQSGQLIEGALVFTVGGAGPRSIQIASNGTNWYIISAYV